MAFSAACQRGIAPEPNPAPGAGPGLSAPAGLKHGVERLPPRVHQNPVGQAVIHDEAVFKEPHPHSRAVRHAEIEVFLRQILAEDVAPLAVGSPVLELPRAERGYEVLYLFSR